MKVFYSCLFAVVIFIEGVWSVTCPLGSTEQNGYCFIASKAATKYHSAQMYCLAYGCKVAVPSAAKKSAIQAFGSANSLTQVVFAVVRALSIDTWVEAPTGLEFTDLVWAASKPSSSVNNECVRIDSLSTWEMKDVGCTGNNQFICECDPE